MSSLRPYQLSAIETLRANMRLGIKKNLIKLATGAGKTVIFSEVMKTTAARNKRAIMVVRGRHLVDQASARLSRENAYHGVLMRNHWNYQPVAPIQICSIDTLIARGLTPPADLIVIDEAHMATSPGYHNFLKNPCYLNSFILGVTATPYTEKSLRHIADEIISPISMLDLISQGFLVPPRYYAPSNPDLSSVHVSKMTGDFVQSELANVMNTNALTGDIVFHWKKLGDNRPTICFASSVEHSKQIVEQFNKLGINAEHCEAETGDEERKAILGRVESGQTKVVSNVGILCTGVDMPYVGCIIMARPTKSLILYLQQAGRGTRPFSGKSDFILLDHAGNVLRHGFITEEPEPNLDGRPIKTEKSPRTCALCYAVFYGFACECGYKAPPSEQKRDVLEIDGNLEEITELPLDAQVLRDITKLKKERKLKGYKRGWVFYRIREKYGEEIAQRFFKQRELPVWFEFEQPSYSDGK